MDASERWKCCWDQTLLYKPNVGKGMQWQISWLVSQMIMLPSPGQFRIPPHHHPPYRTPQSNYNNKKPIYHTWRDDDDDDDDKQRHFNVIADLSFLALSLFIWHHHGPYFIFRTTLSFFSDMSNNTCSRINRLVSHFQHVKPTRKRNANPSLQCSPYGTIMSTHTHMSTTKL